MSAKETLAAAQSLYEEKKLLSYPRTDSRHLSADVAATLPAVVRAISPALRGPARSRHRRAAALEAVRRRRQGQRPPRDPPHDGLRPGPDALAAERRVYDLVCRRLLMAWHDDHVFSVTTVITRVRGPGPDLRRRPLPLERHRRRGHGLEGAGAAEPTRPRPRESPGRRRTADGRRTTAQALAARPRRGPGVDGARCRGGGQEDAAARGGSRTPPCSPPWRRRAAPSTTASWPRR